ncbi:MAG: M10 family metallopeptidase C-terminal domain-containing protein [Hellea sp.]
MAYLFDYNRFDGNLASIDVAGFDVEYELSVATDTAHQSSCCCEACEPDGNDDLAPSEIDYTNYGLNGFTNEWLDFGALSPHHQHDHGHNIKDDGGPLFAGSVDTIPGDSSTTFSIDVGGSGEGVRNGSFGSPDEDWFQIDLVSGQEYTFFMIRRDVNGESAHDDPLLNLYSTDGTGNSLLGSNDDTPSGGQNSRLTFTATETGTHYLGASGWDDTDPLSPTFGFYSTGGYIILAEESDQRANFTITEIAEFLTDGFSPRAYWDQTTITYNMSTIPDGTGGTDNVQALILAALDAWAEVTGLNFVSVTSGEDLNFIDTQGGAYSSSQYGTNGAGDRIITSSTINVSQAQWIGNYGDEINSYSYQTYIHEIGHSLGLGHGGPYNGSSTYGIDNAFVEDTWNHTVMSYHSQGEANSGTSRLVLGLQTADLVAIHDLYGAAASTRGGDTVYGANSTETGSIYDFDAWDSASIRPPSFAIYDTGGIDTFDLSNYSVNQTINLMPSVDTVSSSSVGSYNNSLMVDLITIAVGTIIENAIGGSGDDTITGNDASNELEGNAGNDILDGGDGIDYAVYNGAQASYTITDNMDGTWTITGEGTDTVSNVEFARFTDGDVALAPGGGGGDINGTPNNDTPLNGTSGDDVINGLDGNDVIYGLAGNDTINGDAGADRLIGGTGADALNGGAGFDSADYRGATTAVRFNVDTGGTVGEATGDTFSSIERFYLSDFNDVITGSSANEFFYGEDGNDTINGGGGIDRIYGGDGNDIQRGQDGNDTLYGSAGNDQLNGGAGTDIANYSNASTAVTVNLASGGTVGDAAGDTYFGIEVVYGSDFNDSITGNTNGNELRGEDGDDTLDGGAGNDRLFGGAGADTLIGGTGVDSVYYTDATSAVTVNLSTGGTVGDANGDTYSSIEWVFGSDFDDNITADGGNNRIYGEDGNDTIFGEGGNDRLLGGDGDDSISGGSGVDVIFGQNGDDTLTGNDGNDFFYGGAGADSFDGGADFDTVNYLPAAAGVTVNMLTSGTGGEANGDTFTSIERVLGTGFDDSITGNADNNTLLGNGGNDYLAGGQGNDSLNGGAGVDSFGYDEVIDGADVISGFTTNEVIYLLGVTVADWAALQTMGADAGANVIFNFGAGNTLTIVGQNLADLDASNFDFGGTPPAGEPLSDPDAFAAEPFDDMAMFDMDALI